MKVDELKCVGCGRCFAYCPVQAKYFRREEPSGRVVATVDEDRCVECGVCQRSGVCPNDALRQEELSWPRMVRAILSNPLLEFKETGVPGRGTEEIKTNEITGRIRWGQAGVGVEMGRPGVSTSFADVQRVTEKLAAIGVSFCPDNPVTHFMEDPATGRLRPDILGERALSAIIEFDVPLERLPQALAALKEAAAEIATVFSVAVACKQAREGGFPVLAIIEQAGFQVLPNSKNNLGMGRPRFREAGE